MLCKIICIMEMNQSLFMGIYNILRQEQTLCYVFADLTCHIISLNAVNSRIFIGIFLFDFFIITF